MGICLSAFLFPPGQQRSYAASPKKASWQDDAAAKRRDDLLKIPVEWRLSEDDLERARKQRCIAGDFLDGLLDDETMYLTNLDVSALLEMMANGSLTALKVTRAFCKRLAYAHQLVGQLAVDQERSM